MEKIRIPSPPLLEQYQSGKKLAILVGYILICLMMLCVAFGFVFLGARLIPGWKGAYLIGMVLFLSIEAIYSRKRVADFEQKEKIIFRISEWIAFAILIKTLLYLVNGPAQFLIDLPRWQEDFLTFFTGEYFLALFVAILTWLSSAAFSSEVEELYERENDADWDDLGKLQNVLRNIRNKISSRTFIIGTLLVGLAVIARLDTNIVLLTTAESTRKNILPVLNVLIYFLLALVLLTQTQFALLRTRWITQHLPVSPNLARNWIKYGLIFFIFLAVIVFFLPTNYSIGLLDTLKYALGYLFQAVSFIILLITLPITFCLSLFSFTSKSNASPQSGGLSTLPASPPGQSPAWWDFVRSLAFWIVFLGIIIFALRYYLMQNTALWNAIKKFRLFRWVSDLWRNLRGWLRGTNKQISALFNAGLKRIRAQRASLPASPIRRFFNLSRMNAREKIIFYYLNLIHLGGERGIERNPSQTPYNYQRVLSQSIPEIENELDGLTDTFIEARYSQHPIEEPHAAQAGSFWDRIKTVLRSWHQPDGRK
jgi:hypothetical protein